MRYDYGEGCGMDAEGEVCGEGGVEDHLLPTASMPWGVVDVKR
jgi:hypothetical protein